MNCILVDDDRMSILDLENKVRQVTSLRLVKSCSSAMEASNVILNEQVDLIFLDVLMPDMNGLQFMKALGTECPQVILVSSNKDFAVDAFDYEATDFLIKPVSQERFLRAIAKAKKLYQNGSGIANQEDNHIFVKVNTRLIKVDLRDVLYVEALADYVTIHTSANKYTIHSTMKGMENFLPASAFFRAHNSYIIRLDKISMVEDNSVVMGQKLIPVARQKVKDLKQRLNLLS